MPFVKIAMGVVLMLSVDGLLQPYIGGWSMVVGFLIGVLFHLHIAHAAAKQEHLDREAERERDVTGE